MTDIQNTLPPSDAEPHPEPKLFYKSKTFWVMTLVILVGILQLVGENIILSPEQEGWLAVIVGALGIILRAVSGEPIRWR